MDPADASPFWTNRALFADHFLRERLAAMPEWQSTVGLDAAFDAVAALYRSASGRFTDRTNEAQTEEELVKPILRLLWSELDPDDCIKVQPNLPNVDGRRQPDYALFAHAADRVAAEPELGTLGFWRGVACVGDAKRWAASLDKARASDENPSAQMATYLYRSRVRWGILTNGRVWRLYEQDKARTGGTYFEVDLGAILEAGDRGAFRWFRCFFGRQALLRGADAVCFLDRVLRGSLDYATEVSDRLKESVYDALRLLMAGFLERASNGLNARDAADLARAHEHSLIVLYRLLFLLYAEDRGLLPCGDPWYDDYSLRALQREVNAKLRAKRPFAAGATTIWGRLCSLFGLIDEGYETEGRAVIPAYNGGLFSGAGYPEIAPSPQPGVPRWEIGDDRLAHVVDLLAYDRPRWDQPGERDIDYTTLEVQHLGSIYEGLLELQPQVAEVDLIEVSEGGRSAFRPAAEALEGGANRDTPRRIPAGEVYLVGNRGERKATGSYYTPKFIVDTIVEQTVGPLAEAAARQVADLQAGGHVRHPQDLREPYLRLKVLDPAMGSGHFLVGVADFLSLAMATDPNLPDLPDMADEDPQAFYKRLVVEHCLCGVDINPLAVELAKLSLWLHTVSRDRPLSFLDHHLRCGNSLIGAQVADLPAAQAAPAPRRKRKPADSPMQLALFDYAEFAKHTNQLVFGFGEISRMLSETRQDVHQKAEILRQIDEAHRQPYRELADLWCSRRFGNDVDAAVYSDLAFALQHPGTGLSPLAGAALAHGRELAAAYRFFHWELEFPEVFFDAQGRRPEGAGFDAVVGNPPWERIKLQENEFFALRDRRIALAPTAAKRKELVRELPNANPTLWDEYQAARQRAERELAWVRQSGQYPLMGRGDTNLYAVFTERGRRLLGRKGRLGLVVPSGIATDQTTSAFFADLIETQTLGALLDFENRRKVFPDVDSRFKFTIVSLTGGEPKDEVTCGFFLHGPDHLADPERVFPLRPADCALMNPNTRTCPVFRTRRDYELTRAIYGRVPVLVRETEGDEENPWGVRYHTMFHMTNDSGLFRTAAELETDGFWLADGNVWRKGPEAFVPLYVGKMVRSYDHRAASVEYHAENTFNPYVAVDTQPDSKRDPAMSPAPQFWVPASEVERRGGNRAWALVFRDIARATDERTIIAAGVPRVGLGNTLPALDGMGAAPDGAVLLGNLNAVVLDFLARVKMAATHMNFFIVKQLPVLPPSRYEDDFGGVRLRDFVAERVLELTYTAHDMAGFAEVMGYVDAAGHAKPPFPWDEERRLHLRCQLDALYFHLYGLTRDEADYVLSTFPIVRRHDEQRFGRYRTRDLILAYYNAYAAGDMSAWVKG